MYSKCSLNHKLLQSSLSHIPKIIDIMVRILYTRIRSWVNISSAAAAAVSRTPRRRRFWLIGPQGGPPIANKASPDENSLPRKIFPFFCRLLANRRRGQSPNWTSFRGPNFSKSASIANGFLRGGLGGVVGLFWCECNIFYLFVVYRCIPNIFSNNPGDYVVNIWISVFKMCVSPPAQWISCCDWRRPASPGSIGNEHFYT